MGSMRAERRPLVDRRAQHLPVPIGDMRPVHGAHGRSRARRTVRRVGPTLMSAFGIGAAGAGLLLTAVAGPVAVFATAGTLHVGTTVLLQRWSVGGSTLYDGDVLYFLTTATDGSVTATAAWRAGPVDNRGTCTMRRQRRTLVEACTFTSAGVVSTSVDSYPLDTAGPWRRTYADGDQVVIAVPDGTSVVPVPFPIEP